jgi:hypothetical protein
LEMKRAVRLGSLLIFAAALTACGPQTSTTSAESEAKPDSTPAPVADKPPVDPKVTIPAGTKLRVALLDAVSSDKSRAGDPFIATLTEPVVIDGKTVLAKGTRVRGRVVNAVDSGRVKGRASLELKLTEIVKDNKPIGISTKSYVAVAESTKKRDAAIIGGGAGVGAAIGAIAGGGKGAAIGAAVGGGAGTGTVLATKGKQVRFAPEHRLSFTLSSPVQI